MLSPACQCMHIPQVWGKVFSFRVYNVAVVDSVAMFVLGVLLSPFESRYRSLTDGQSRVEPAVLFDDMSDRTFSAGPLGFRAEPVCRIILWCGNIFYFPGKGLLLFCSRFLVSGTRSAPWQADIGEGIRAFETIPRGEGMCST